jgi:HEAT repeat protein
MRLMRLCLPLLLVLLLAALTVAQDGDGTDGPGDKPGIRFVDPKKGGEPKPGKKTPKADEKDAPEDGGTAALIAALNTWPSPAAEAAIRDLADDGEKSRPLLLKAISGRNRKARCGAALALARIGNAEDAKAVLGVTSDGKLSRYADVLLLAGEKLDAEKARERAFRLLMNAPRPAQERAARFLETRLRDDERPALEKVLDSRSRGGRILVLGLLTRRYGAEAARSRVVAALGDRSPDVCLQAAGLLSVDDGATETLAGMARDLGSREAGYAAMAMLMRALTEGSQPFDKETIAGFMGGIGLRSSDAMSRGVAAMVLAHIGYEEGHESIDKILETEILPVLFSNVGGAGFFPDRPSLTPLSIRILQRLTGCTYGMDVRSWRGWWDVNRESFQVRRRLREMKPHDYAALTLDLALPGRSPIRLSTDAERLADGAIIIDPEVARGFVDVLTNAGFFGDEWSPSGAAGDLAVTIRVGRRERSATLPAADLPPAVAGLSGRLEAIRGRNVWQRFWDHDDYATAEAFILARSAWFRPEVPREKREAYLRIVIAEALDDIPADERADAIALLGKLEGPPLAERLCYAIIVLAEAEKGLTPVSVGAIRFLVEERATIVCTRLVDFLGAMKGPRAFVLLAESLGSFGREKVLQVLNDSRPVVRRAAVRALSIVGGPGSIMQLRALLNDSDHGVRLEALASLGTMKARSAIEDIERAAKDESRSDLRAAALRALGAVGGRDAITTLVDALRSSSVAVRVAAIQGLEATADEEAISPLLYAMQRDPYAGVIVVASRAVVKIGGPKAGAGLRRLASDAAVKAPVRTAATQALCQLGDRDALAALLDDGSIALEAALGLAELRDARAVPVLLDALAGGNVRRVLPALEGLSARTFGVRARAEVATLFLGWWEVHKDGTPTDWLITAMKDRGYEVAPLAPGGVRREALGLLIRGLDDESWAIRYSASRELTDRTGQAFGRIEKYTSREDALKIADLWRRWWSEQR